MAHRSPPRTRRRVAVRAVSPEVDAGRFASKRVVGEPVDVEADAFTDGHDLVACAVAWRQVRPGQDPDADWPSSAADEHATGPPAGWDEAPMRRVAVDRFRGTFTPTSMGLWQYTVTAWVDRFGTWRRDLATKVEAGQDVHVDLLAGADLLAEAAAAAGRRRNRDATRLRAVAAELRDEAVDGAERAAVALDASVHATVDRWLQRSSVTRYPRVLDVVVERERARFSTWYELFPRSASPEPGRHGTLRDVEARLDDIAEHGFDVLYLPPIHPIGTAHRKGPNNALEAGPDDPGSPWAIGGPEGGHTAVHPELGTVEDVERLAAACADRGMDLALDLAFQCSPDHPWVDEHPQWFRQRPDGSIQYAENPPKKYQDIYPFDFECEDWEALWDALLGVVLFWVERGVRVFRVDNPHTKPFRFWEWCIAEVRRRHPDVLFLAEAFTRPKVMAELGKLGFTQGYTYFTWRNSAAELREYFEQLSATDMVDWFRPNAWPNTPDILPEYLQHGGRSASFIRLVLAATLSPSYGIYGPAFELVDNRAVRPGSEEYLDSEKYQLRHWDLDAPGSLRRIVRRVNRIRHEHPALHDLRSLYFHDVDNPALLAFSKRAGDDLVLVVATTDPFHRQAGWTNLHLDELGLGPDEEFEVADLLGEGTYRWRGAHNYVELDPHVLPAHVLHLRPSHRSEADFPGFD